jgi:hypothetical protein
MVIYFILMHGNFMQLTDWTRISAAKVLLFVRDFGDDKRRPALSSSEEVQTQVPTSTNHDGLE